MNKIIFDKDKCINCGLCIKDCVTGCLEFDNENYPYMQDANRCISCQHCFSICPTGAISIDGKKPTESSNVEYNDILQLIKSRRSIRQYKDEEIPHQLWKNLKAMFPYIPTGCNSHSLHFTLVESKSAMDEIRERVRKMLLKSLSYKFLSPIINKFSKYKDAFINGEDIIFRGAPHMIIVSSSITAPCANVDPIIALSYIELYAQHLGLGTCWCGFAQACLKLYPELCESLDIPDGYKPVYVMLLGIPDVKYQRVPLPEQYKINEITKLKENNSCFICKIKRLVTNFLR